MTDYDLRDDAVMTYRHAVTPDALWLLRQLLDQWLTDRGVSAVDIGDLMVVANELCTEVVVHGDEEIDITMQLRDDVVELSVCEHEPVTLAPPTEVPPLARALSDDVDVRSTSGMTRTSCRRRVTLLSR